MINKVAFPEISSAQVNVALVADKLNEVIEFINLNTDEGEDEGVECNHENSYQMRPGLMRCKDCKLIYKV